MSWWSASTWARATSSSRVYTAPVGLDGELSSNTRVLSVMAAARASGFSLCVLSSVATVTTVAAVMVVIGS